MSLTKSFSTSPTQSPNSTQNLDTSDQFQLFQSHLLESTFSPPNHPCDQVFAGSYINLFFDPRRPQHFKCPDWFGIIGLNKRQLSKNILTSYVTWQERFNPFIVVEFLEAETATEDLGQTPDGVDDIPTKWDVYEQILRIPYYILFDAQTHQLEAFQLVGSRYEQLEITEQRIWIPDLELGLGLWQGDYSGVERHWLRWYDREENWIEFPKKQQQIHPQQSERIQQQKQLNKQQKLGKKISERLKSLGLKRNFI